MTHEEDESHLRLGNIIAGRQRTEFVKRLHCNRIPTLRGSYNAFAAIASEDKPFSDIISNIVTLDITLGFLLLGEQ